MVCGGLLRNRTIYRYGHLFTYRAGVFFKKENAKNRGCYCNCLGDIREKRDALEYAHPIQSNAIVYVRRYACQP